MGVSYRTSRLLPIPYYGVSRDFGLIMGLRPFPRHQFAAPTSIKPDSLPMFL